MHPNTQFSAFLLEEGARIKVKQSRVPNPGPDQVLVRITAAAINPIDYKCQKEGIFIKEYPVVLGTDGAGIVEAVGSKVTRFQPGDRVMMQGRFNSNTQATFQQFCVAAEDVISITPDNITDEEASTIPVASMCAAVGLFHDGEVSFPSEKTQERDDAVVVMGGSSSVGQFVIQLARLAGFTHIVTTSSLEHTSFLQNLGATHVIDRHGADISLRIRAALGTTPCTLIFDAISITSTLLEALAVFPASPSFRPHSPSYKLIAVQAPKEEVLAANARRRGPVVNIKYAYGSSYRFREISVPFWQNIREWVENGEYVPNRVTLVPGGLDGVQDALDLYGRGVSGEKLVIRPQERKHKGNSFLSVFMALYKCMRRVQGAGCN